MNFLKLFSVLGQLVPGIIKLVGIFRKKKEYIPEEINEKAEAELGELKAWKDKAEVERLRTLGK